jgi:hypothetical protein
VCWIWIDLVLFETRDRPKQNKQETCAIDINCDLLSSTFQLFVVRLCLWLLIFYLSLNIMVFSGQEAFKGGASAPSLEREVSGIVP